jgi:branched-chain amino acid transport system ATP-binding protein
MTQGEAAEIADVVRDLCQLGLTVIIIEHNLKFLTSVADRVLVLETGKVLAEGSLDILKEPKVVEAYFGFATE